ncbi:hypothetical protein [uncultured Parasphingorhabdus sp.]|uniref:hypothetical protein n=1 Tax=uncultured Parasphingorhabdus sp. TaxID=2709694 RepID=UPI0030D9D105|tara:strand:- start:27894 stop:29333 length:1440 start_codon:yes stop_codon:yes gene_type:complete
MRVALIVTASLSVFLSGCATVKTHGFRHDQSNAEGMSYFLPKREVAFVGARAPLRKADVEKKIKAAVTALGAAEDAEKAAKIEKAAADNALNANPISSLRRQKLQDDATIAEFKAGDAQRTQLLKKAEIIDLEDTLRTFGDKACIYSYDVKLELQPFSPDPSARFVANLSHNILRDDEQKFMVSSDGLLSSANVTAADRTGDVIVELAGAFAAFGGGSLPVARSKVVGEEPVAPVNCDTPIKDFRYIFDPISEDERKKVNDELNRANWPFFVDAEVKNLLEQRSDAEAPSRKVPLLTSNTFDHSGNCKKEPIQNASQQKLQLCQPVDGLLYRTALPATITIRQCVGGCNLSQRTPGVPVQGALVALPQAGPVSYIPLRSSAFVKTVDNIVFDKGMLTSWEANRPSEVLEIVRLPIRLLKAVISVPAEILQLRVNYSSQAESLSSGYAKQLEAQQKLISLQQCFRKAENTNGDPSLCLVE